MVHDVGEHEGLLFFVMEYLKGEDLAKIIRRCPAGLSIDRVLSVGIQLADALDAAHRRGVVHRDIKPANIMLTAVDRVKVCDFGVARIMEPTAGETGTVGVGTPLYSAPEQFDGRAGAQADLYSLGCVLYELLTGCTPFQGSPVELMYKHKHEVPAPVDSLRTETPSDLNSLVMALLDKAPRKRPHGGGEVKETLRALRRRLREAAVGAAIVVSPQENGGPEPGARRAARQCFEPPPASLLGSGDVEADTARSSRDGHAVRLGRVLRSMPTDTEVRPLLVGLGESPAGGLVVDLAHLSHMLIAGDEPAENAAAVHSLVVSILMHAVPDRVRMILVDSQRTGLSIYAGIPHLLTPVLTTPEKAVGALGWVVEEMERRYDDLAEHGYRHIHAYNEAVRLGRLRRPEHAVGGGPHPYVIVVVEELADLMAVARRETEDRIGKLTRLARAVGIHLVLATSQVTERTLSRRLTADVPSRLALKTASIDRSELVIDLPGAERLVKGEALFLPKGESKPARIRCATVTEQEIESVVAHWVRQV
ncbi:hypothetical protein Acsp03_63600 [Actinomadura sp. NBRC 104412]|nr:hypothetical protein Acsp03_63600 [Actinomadura sp. NBRC 104412]